MLVCGLPNHEARAGATMHTAQTALQVAKRGSILYFAMSGMVAISARTSGVDWTTGVYLGIQGKFYIKLTRKSVSLHL